MWKNLERLGKDLQITPLTGWRTSNSHLKTTTGGGGAKRRWQAFSHTKKFTKETSQSFNTFGVSRSQTSVVKTLLIFCRSFMASASSAVYAGHPTSKKLLLCHGKRDAAVKVFLYSMMYFSTRLQIDKLVRRFGNSRALVKLFLNISNFKLTEIDWSRYQLCCILATCSFSR